VGLRSGLDRYGKSRPTGIRFPNRLARRQSLYRLRYPAHICFIYHIEMVLSWESYIYIYVCVCVCFLGGVSGGAVG